MIREITVASCRDNGDAVIFQLLNDFSDLLDRGIIFWTVAKNPPPVTC